MKKSILIIFIFTQLNLFTNPVFAEKKNQSLPVTELKNQFDEKVMIQTATEWIIFSADKKSSETIGKILEELKITQPEQHQGIFIADISAMPSMITKMFALPKMKKYSYKLALDLEGEFSKKIPQEKEKATLLELKDLSITHQILTSNPAEIKSFIEKHTKAK